METPGATRAQELYGSGVAPDMTSTSGFRAPVGQVGTPAMVCSGTAIGKSTVLTAAHAPSDFSQAFTTPVLLSKVGGSVAALSQATARSRRERSGLGRRRGVARRSEPDVADPD
jgi:hypothetical protein